MKTLDEVIKAYECCNHDDGCEDCPYNGITCTLERETDALHYLKEFKRYQNTPSRNGHMTLVDYFEESQKNEPLTWDELKQMGGKAVWIEGTHHKHWCIIKGIARKDLSEMEYITLAYLNNKNRIVTYDRRKGNFDVTWQAYRKEHK